MKISWGRVVLVVDLQTLALHRRGFESRFEDLKFFYVRKLSIQLAYGTSVGLLSYPLVSEIMHGATSIRLESRLVGAT